MGEFFDLGQRDGPRLEFVETLHDHRVDLGHQICREQEARFERLVGRLLAFGQDFLQVFRELPSRERRTGCGVHLLPSSQSPDQLPQASFIERHSRCPLGMCLAVRGRPTGAPPHSTGAPGTQPNPSTAPLPLVFPEGSECRPCHRSDRVASLVESTHYRPPATRLGWKRTHCDPFHVANRRPCQPVEHAYQGNARICPPIIRGASALRACAGCGATAKCLTAWILRAATTPSFRIKLPRLMYGMRA